MRISDIHIDDFGICKDLDFSEIRSPLLTIYGPNEAGKTTSMEFIRGVLFGYRFPEHSQYINGTSEDHGGVLKATDSEGNHWVVQRNTAVGKDVAIEINGQLHPVSSLQRDLLAGVGPEVFNNVFTVGLGELQQLNQLNSTDAAHFLYEMTTGFDRVTLGGVLRGISTSRSALMDSVGLGTITDLQEQYTKARDHLDQHQARLSDWLTHKNGINSVELQIEELQHSIEEIRNEQHTLEARLQANELLSELNEVRRWLDDHRQLAVHADSGVISSREKLIAIAVESQQYLLAANDGEQELLELEVSLASLRGLLIENDLFLRLQAFGEMRPWIQSLLTDLEDLQESAGDSPSGAFGEGNVFPRGFDSIDASMLNQRLLKELRQPARELRHAQSRIEEMNKEVGSIELELSEAEADWLANSSWEEIGLLPDLERPSFCLGDAIEQQQKELEAIRHSLNKLQAVEMEGAIPEGPVPSSSRDGRPELSSLLLSGTLCCVGGTLLGMGLLFPDQFGLSSGASIFCVLVGLVSLGAGVFSQWRDVRRQQELARKGKRRRELAILRRREESVFDEESTSTRIEELRSRHQLSEDRIKVLNQLRMDAIAIERCRIRLQAAQKRVTQHQDHVLEAEERWNASLEEAGVTVECSPSDLYEAVKRADDLHAFQRLHRERMSSARRKASELAELDTRVSSLLADAGINASHLTIVGKLERAIQLVTMQQDLREQLSHVTESITETNQRLGKFDEQMAAARRELINSCAEVGVPNLHGLHQLCLQVEQFEQKTARAESLKLQIQEVASTYHCDESQLFDVPHQSEQTLEDSWQDADEVLSQFNSSLNQLHELLGEKKAEVRHFERDEQVRQQRLTSATLGAQLEQQQHSWRVWATSELICDRVRAVYESQRQPETLRDASLWLSEITAGNYTRIWTPLGEDVLYVDDAVGQPWAIDSLSRGTRESIFISLRFALVRSYQKDGISLPLILDDVLVNCDLERAQNAIRAIKQFSDEVGQVLFFTCHAHIAKLLESAGADVREIIRPQRIQAPAIPRIGLTASSPPSTVLEANVEVIDDPQEVVKVDEIDDIQSSLQQIGRDIEEASMHEGGVEDYGEEIELEIVEDEDAVDPVEDIDADEFEQEAGEDEVMESDSDNPEEDWEYEYEDEEAEDEYLEEDELFEDDEDWEEGDDLAA